jgi:hypothetical protein
VAGELACGQSVAARSDWKRLCQPYANQSAKRQPRLNRDKVQTPAPHFGVFPPR